MTTPQPVTRRELLTALIEGEKAVARVEIKEVTLAPKQTVPLHMHPCPVVGVVSVGSIAYQIEGQPVRQLQAGDAFFEPAGARVARFDNGGETPARFVAFYLLGAGDTEIIRVLSA